ncbi:PTR2-domain-containing protein [Dissoconium aciculare CBS 342.82]|uniref:PTR2-domain-containing protein n=1 Tax=Dissoconium aciculare CBS 342.82 TaxID=1314786 RepID=A0A6J3LRH1_9PEZI|nr:PTR2-domain-containing protein [Dissoconium aciculare CBS 342.82]KAF1817879.1 PTR2-domain-containing protein [Dissoconium aciculare CBS 342.82]
MNRSTRPSWLSSVTRILPQPRAPTDLRGGYTRVDGHELGDLTNRATESAGSSSQRNPDDFEFDASAEARDYSSRQYPTEIELKTLGRVADDLPWSAFLIAVVELCERFAYYGLVGPFQNYMANKWHDPNGLPGAIGLGQVGATALSNLFMFFLASMPIFAAVVADQYLGRYYTIFYGMLIYIIGLAILSVTSLPSFIEAGFALPGLLISMIFIGIGGGGIKANVSALIAEQYTETKPFVRITRSGKKVIVDPPMTITRIFSIFYLCINIGSLSPILTTSLESSVGFYAAYFLCFAMFIIGLITLIYGKNNYIIKRPTGSPVFDALRIIWIRVRTGTFEAAKSGGGRGKAGRPWSDRFVEELKKALEACRVFLFFPIYWVAFNQMNNNFVSQAGQMERHNIPNDIMSNLDPIIIIIMIPICDKYIFPYLAKRGFGSPVQKITLGFLLGAATLLYASLIQSRIYASGPCYTSPSNCPEAFIPPPPSAPEGSLGSYRPNEISILWQIPAYILIAMSEIFASVPSLEFAYSRAPKELKSFVMGMFPKNKSFEFHRTVFLLLVWKP